ncbi:hypothetical protein ACH5RR_041059 [Cinchona calisaya]|uniref:Uncharacterized protein n=1 Tax=Cinchona calisaya TaxID=153742 RepID=A0ABD2XSV9_9GENT
MAAKILGQLEENTQDDHIPTLCAQVDNSTFRCVMEDEASKDIEGKANRKDDFMLNKDIYKEEYLTPIGAQMETGWLKTLRWIGIPLVVKKLPPFAKEPRS